MIGLLFGVRFKERMCDLTHRKREGAPATRDNRHDQSMLQNGKEKRERKRSEGMIRIIIIRITVWWSWCNKGGQRLERVRGRPWRINEQIQVAPKLLVSGKEQDLIAL